MPATNHEQDLVHEKPAYLANVFVQDGLNKNEPDIIYGVDQKTSEERLKIDAKEFNVVHGILSTHGRLYYAEKGASKDDPTLYTSFKAVDKKTGNIQRTISIDPQRALPL